MDRFIIIELVYDKRYKIAFKTQRGIEQREVHVPLADVYHLNSGKTCTNDYASLKAVVEAIDELYSDLRNTVM